MAVNHLYYFSTHFRQYQVILHRRSRATKLVVKLTGTGVGIPD